MIEIDELEEIRNHDVITVEEPVAEAELNLDGFCSYYFPLQSFLGFSIMPIPILDPKVSSVIFFNVDPTTYLLINSMIGTTMYLSTRTYMKKFTKYQQTIFSFGGGMMFPFAAMYGWQLCSQVLPDIPVVNSIFGLLTAFGYMKLCKRYISTMDLIVN